MHVNRQLRIETLKTEFDALKANNKLFSSDIFPLAIRTREAMENQEMSSSLVAQFKELKESLPLCVRVIVWNENTHIINKMFSTEYLYAVYDNAAYDADRRIIYTWIPGGRHSQGGWEFSTKTNGKSFLIKNLHYSEYLFAAANSYAYDSERRNVFSWRPGTSDGCEWLVEIVSNDEIMLKSKDNNEYLYAATNGFNANESRRRVFTWRPKTACNDACVWKLSPESNQ